MDSQLVLGRGSCRAGKPADVSSPPSGGLGSLKVCLPAGPTRGVAPSEHFGITATGKDSPPAVSGIYQQIASGSRDAYVSVSV